MIQLYRQGNTDYTRNGDFTLHPTKALLDMTLNSDWTLSLEVPESPEVLENLKHDSVIKLDLPRYKDQLYVVSNPRRTDFQTITAQACPIALWDARNELVCLDCRPTNMNGGQALDYILKGCGGSGKYTCESDISKISTAYYERKNFIECLASGDDNCFLTRWGGEIFFDNYHISVNQAAGVDRDIVLSVSRNIAGFTVTEDDSEYCDVLIPVGFNGRTKGTRVYRKNRSRVDHIRFVDYQDIRLQEDVDGGDTEGLTICKTMEELDAALVKAAERDFASGAYQPKYSYDIDYVDLRHYGGYEQMDDLLYLWLGDRVTVENLDSHISSRQKVTKLTYNLVTDQIESLVLGSEEKDFFRSAASTAHKVDQVVSENGTLIGEKVSGILNAMDVQLKAQKSAAVKQDVRAVLHEDTDPDSPTFGAICLGTKGLEIAEHRTADGTDWAWGTAVTAKSIVADYMITGLLSGKGGNFWFNLDSGAFELGSGLFKGDIDTTSDINVGKCIYLDFDNNSRSSRSGLYLGSQSQKGKASRIEMNSTLLDTANPWSVLEMIAGSSDRARVTLTDTGVAGGATVVLTSDGSIRLESRDILVVKDGKAYTGVTYEGIVSKVKTVNGIVTGVS
ncbi:phage tail spike protein [Faecalibaculum rodentium]|uniref:phage tail spike protein n=1 Tax=Faecalibaculum rodentium TaxID=1702221 RepID=UPI0023F1260F|nr:phage tail spike protein [Faecalibaculum rodentium]